MIEMVRVGVLFGQEKALFVWAIVVRMELVWIVLAEIVEERELLHGMAFSWERGFEAFG